MTKTTRDPEATRAAILNAAIEEFARDGFGGARVDKISRRAGTNDRMLYYYYASKEGLFRAVLERVYADLIDAENALDLEALDPLASMRTLIAFTWQYYLDHPEFISLLNTENLLRAAHVRDSKPIQALSSPQLRIVGALLDRGAASGHFRRDVTAVEMVLTITSLAYFYLSNEPTLSNYLTRDLSAQSERDAWLTHITRVVMDFLMVR